MAKRKISIPSGNDVFKMFGAELDELNQENLIVTEYFHLICLGPTNFDDVLSLLSTGNDPTDEDIETPEYGAYEEDIDFPFDHISSKKHRQLLRDGVTLKELMSHYTIDQVIEDLENTTYLIIYRKEENDPAYIIHSTELIRKLYEADPEATINIVSMGC